MSRTLIKTISDTSRNYIINGNFDFWQRGTSGTTGYIADRWKAASSGTCTHSRETSDIPAGSVSAYKWLTGAGSSYGQMRQYIESDTVKKLRGKTLTLCWLSKVNGTFSGQMVAEVSYSPTSDSSGAGDFSIITTTSSIQTSTSSYVKSVATFVVPSNAVGLYLGIVPNAAQASGTQVLVTQVQLIEGTHTDPMFSTAGKNYEEEFALCERYYQYQRQRLWTKANNSTTWYVIWPYRTVMRTIAAVSLTTSTPYTESLPQQVANPGSGSTITTHHTSTPETWAGAVGGFSGLTANVSMGFWDSNNLVADAEL